MLPLQILPTYHLINGNSSNSFVQSPRICSSDGTCQSIRYQGNSPNLSDDSYASQHIRRAISIRFYQVPRLGVPYGYKNLPGIMKRLAMNQSSSDIVQNRLFHGWVRRW